MYYLVDRAKEKMGKLLQRVKAVFSKRKPDTTVAAID
jgi:hypothetical protein